jgi:hypothetical protein
VEKLYKVLQTWDTKYRVSKLTHGNVGKIFEKSRTIKHENIIRGSV